MSIFYSELPDVAEGIQDLPAGETAFVIIHPDFKGAPFEGRVISPEDAEAILAEGAITLGEDTYKVREPLVRRWNSAKLDHSRDFEILNGKKAPVLVSPGKYLIHSSTFLGGYIQSVRPDFAALALSSGLYSKELSA